MTAGTAAAAPSHPFVPGTGGSGAAGAGRLPPSWRLDGLLAGNGGGVFQGKGHRRFPLPVPDAGGYQRTR